MKKRLLFMSALAVFTLAGCDNTAATTTTTSNEVVTTSKEDEALKTENEALKAENEKIKAELEAAKKANGELETSNNTLKDDKTKLESDVSNLETSVDSLTKENEKLLDENKSIKQSIKSYLKYNNEYAVSFTNYLGNTESAYFKVNDYSTVLEALSSFADVNASTSDYGTYINSINNSFFDNNWAIMVYENYESSAVGVDGLQIDAGDVFEFKHECWNTVESGWGTFDEYDILVDQVIYHYAKDRFKTTLNDTTTWTGSTYWEDMALYKLITAESQYGGPLYDTNLFNTSLINADLKTAISSKNVEELEGTDLFKFYYAARLTDLDLTAFTTKYGAYVESFTEYGEWGEYTIPFVTSTAKTLGLIDKLSDNVKNTTYKPDASQWGPDGISWQLTGMASYKELADTDLTELSFDKLENSLSKDVSLSSMILPYAASNKSVRSVKNSDGVDVIEYLFDNYFDASTMKFTTEASGTDFSSNQIYAALVAYKVQRDTQKACNLFE